MCWFKPVPNVKETSLIIQQRLGKGAVTSCFDNVSIQFCAAKDIFSGWKILNAAMFFPPPHPVPLNECSTWSRPDFPSKKKRATGYIRRWWRMIQLSVHDGVVDATALFTLALPIQWLVWDVSISIHSNTRWKSTLSSISYSKSDFLKNIYISLVKIHLFRSSFDLSIVDWNITYLIGDSNSATLKFDGVYQ